MSEACSRSADVAALQSDVKTIFKRIDEQLALSKAVYELASEIKVMNTRIQMMSDGQDALKRDVEELKNSPKRRIEMIVGATVAAAVTGLVTFVLVRLGLK